MEEGAPRADETTGAMPLASGEVCFHGCLLARRRCLKIETRRMHGAKGERS
jgi:hypothetical protein